MTHYERTNPKARKPHRCGSCLRTIQPGETYLRGVGMEGGSAWTWKECGHCERLSEFVVRLHGLDEYGGEDLHDWDPDGLAELRVKVHFRKRWTRQDGTLFPLPGQVTGRQDLGHGFSITRVVGILPGAT